MMRLRLIGAGLAITGLALAGGVTSASAVPPVPIDETVSGNDPVADCGTFTVWDEFTLTSTGYLHFDSDGNPVRIVQRVSGSDRLYNPENSKSLSGTINAGEIVDLVEGQAIESGQTFRILVPGSGAVLLNIGRFVFDFEEGLVFLKGNQQFFEGDLEALCTALS
jgi:hypothetical protein